MHLSLSIYIYICIIQIMIMILTRDARAQRLLAYGLLAIGNTSIISICYL